MRPRPHSAAQPDAPEAGLTHSAAALEGLKGAHGRVTRAMLLAAAGASLGCLLFGFDTAVISGTTSALQAHFALSDAALGFTVASALIGTMMGALGSGWPADRFGRRPLLGGIAAIYVLSALGSALAVDWTSLTVWRFVGGLAIGASSVVTPIYIAESSPAVHRGRLVALSQLNVVLGILLAYLSNWLLAALIPAALAWRWMLGIVTLPALVLCVVALVLPESPRWLLQHGRERTAREVLARLGFVDPDAELARIRDAQPRADRASQRLLDPAHTHAILCAVGVAMFNQLSGINALMYYAPHIFELAGASAASALGQSVAVGGVNLLFTVLALFLIDRIGRRPLLYVGALLMTAALFLVAVEFGSGRPSGSLVLAGLLAFIAAFAVSQGAVIWVFISEVFPSPVRGKGQALGSATHWIMAAIVTWTFPAVVARFGGYVFAFFGAMMLLQLLFIRRLLPETRGVPLEEMDRRLQTRS